MYKLIADMMLSLNDVHYFILLMGGKHWESLELEFDPAGRAASIRRSYPLSETGAIVELSTFLQNKRPSIVSKDDWNNGISRILAAVFNVNLEVNHFLTGSCNDLKAAQIVNDNQVMLGQSQVSIPGVITINIDGRAFFMDEWIRDCGPGTNGKWKLKNYNIVFYATITILGNSTTIEIEDGWHTVHTECCQCTGDCIEDPPPPPEIPKPPPEIPPPPPEGEPKPPPSILTHKERIHLLIKMDVRGIDETGPILRIRPIKDGPWINITDWSRWDELPKPLRDRIIASLGP